MASVTVDDVRVREDTIWCEITPSPSLRRFFSSHELVVEYDVDVSHVPEGILVIPTLAHVCPVAWTRDADVHVDVVDRSFAEALPAVRDALRAMYPQFMQGGTLHTETLSQHRNAVAGGTPSAETSSTLTARGITDNAQNASVGTRDGPSGSTASVGTGGSTEPAAGAFGSTDTAVTESRAPTSTDGSNSSDAGGTALCFTGGVDSMCSYVRNRERDPTLVGIRGWTVTDDAEWAKYRRYVEGFADVHGCETQFVESNMLSFLDHPMLLAHYKRHLIGGWYSAVGSGIGMLGLLAPLCWAVGYEDLRLAASHWDGIDLPWGSHPSIDDSVAWSGTQCTHDSYDLTRQEKLEYIATHVDRTGDDLEIRVCNDRLDGNCGTCSKCCRTAIGIAVAGLDPTEYGFPFDDSTYAHVRRMFERGEWLADEDTRIMWEDIQSHVDPADAPSLAGAAFYEWALETDFAAIVDGSSRPVQDRAIRALARKTPYPVYSTLYPVYDELKHRL